MNSCCSTLPCCRSCCPWVRPRPALPVRTEVRKAEAQRAEAQWQAVHKILDRGQAHSKVRHCPPQRNVWMGTWKATRASLPPVRSPCNRAPEMQPADSTPPTMRMTPTLMNRTRHLAAAPPSAQHQHTARGGQLCRMEVYPRPLAVLIKMTMAQAQILPALRQTIWAKTIWANACQASACRASLSKISARPRL